MLLSRNWIKFDGVTRNRGFKRHHVTINHKGEIHFGRQVHTDLGRPRHVTIYHEPTLNKLAIRPAEPKTSGAVRLIEKMHEAYYISVSQFLAQRYINIEGTQVFLNPEINLNGILILDLNQTARITRGGHVVTEFQDEVP
ncbi:MAG: hypothetical protein QM785_06525 [Pyrinomonadaceae bacterium]